MQRPNSSNLVLDNNDPTSSNNASYRLGKSNAIRSIITSLDAAGTQKSANGLNERMFTFGVLNSFLILFIFGVYPQHFWLLYLVEALYFVPVKFLQMIRAVPNQGFYYLDFCWIMNFGGIIGLLMMMFGNGVFPVWFHKTIFLTSFGVSCGPLMMANMTLPFIALVFHDVASMTSTFIHIYPPLLLYVFRWRAEDVKEAWPNTFRLDYDDDFDFFPGGGVSFLESIFGGSLLLYFAWFIPYILWLLFIGLDLPKDNGRFDTVFHANMRNGLTVQFGTLFFHRPIAQSIEQNKTNEFEMRDVAIYIAGHVFGYIVSLLVLAYPCSLSRYVHGALLFVCMGIITWRGAQRYTYYSTKMYARLIRKEFAADLLQPDDDDEAALSNEFGGDVTFIDNLGGSGEEVEVVVEKR